MTNTWSNDGRWRRDGLAIVNVPGSTTPTYAILPNDERQEIITLVPTTGRPIVDLRQANRIADQYYPLSVSA